MAATRATDEAIAQLEAAQVCPHCGGCEPMLPKEEQYWIDDDLGIVELGIECGVCHEEYSLQVRVAACVRALPYHVGATCEVYHG